MYKSFLTITTIGAGLLLASCGENNKPSEETAVVPVSVMEGDATLTVDQAKSIVQWGGVMLGVKDHAGTINVKQGTIQLSNGQLKGGNLVIDMATMIATDANFQPEQGSTKEKLVGHLSSPDFFDVVNHPTAAIVINSVTGNTAKANLTVRGKTNEETITDIVLVPEGDAIRLTGKLTFNRKNYDVAFDTGAKDMVISDDITIGVDLVATR